MKKLIVNADDFGLSAGTNRGIVEAFRHGILTSTTMLANMDAFDEAVSLAGENPGLAVGVHLSLLWGPPVSDPGTVPTLVEGDGCFPRSLGVLARRYFLGRLSGDDVTREFRAQVRKVVDAGLQPTHLDTHKHAHCLPGVLRAVLSVAREFAIERVRMPVERRLHAPPGADAPGTGWKPRTRRRLVSLLCRSGRDRVLAAKIRTTDHFVGIEHSDCLNSQVLEFILYSLEEGSTELMCHPGYTDEGARRFVRIPPHREIELEGLKDPGHARRLADAGIQLCSYRDI